MLCRERRGEREGWHRRCRCALCDRHTPSPPHGMKPRPAPAPPPAFSAPRGRARCARPPWPRWQRWRWRPCSTIFSSFMPGWASTARRWHWMQCRRVGKLAVAALGAAAAAAAAFCASLIPAATSFSTVMPCLANRRVSLPLLPPCGRLGPPTSHLQSRQALPATVTPAWLAKPAASAKRRAKRCRHWSAASAGPVGKKTPRPAGRRLLSRESSGAAHQNARLPAASLFWPQSCRAPWPCCWQGTLPCGTGASGGSPPAPGAA